MDVSTSSPASPDPNPAIEPFLSQLIRRKARQITRRSGFSASDRVDVEQELHLKVVKNAGRFDAAQGHLYAFLTAVVERQAATVAHDRTAHKRDPRRVTSLSVQVKVEDDAVAELAATITHRELDARLGTKTRSGEDACNLNLDVAATINRLPPDERDICERLKHGSITDVARDLGIPRSNLYEMIARWRQTFEAAGFRDYL